MAKRTQKAGLSGFMRVDCNLFVHPLIGESIWDMMGIRNRGHCKRLM